MVNSTERDISGLKLTFKMHVGVSRLRPRLFPSVQTAEAIPDELGEALI